jgi:hypothetical protein
VFADVAIKEIVPAESLPELFGKTTYLEIRSLSPKMEFLQISFSGLSDIEGGNIRELQPGKVYLLAVGFFLDIESSGKLLHYRTDFGEKGGGGGQSSESSTDVNFPALQLVKSIRNGTIATGSEQMVLYQYKTKVLTQGRMSTGTPDKSGFDIKLIIRVLDKLPSGGVPVNQSPSFSNGGVTIIQSPTSSK